MNLRFCTGLEKKGHIDSEEKVKLYICNRALDNFSKPSIVLS